MGDVVGSVIGAAGSMFGGSQAASGAEDAARTQAAAAGNSKIRLEHL